MNAPFDHSSSKQIDNEPAFAEARSRCIDAFARLEMAVGHAAMRLQLGTNKGCLGRRVAALAKAEPSPFLSKANHAKLPNWIAETEKLVETRATLVHSVMQIGTFTGNRRAIFANVADKLAGSPMAAQFSLREMHNTCRAVDAQTSKLHELVKGIPET